jgi:hypothetical protein
MVENFDSLNKKVEFKHRINTDPLAKLFNTYCLLIEEVQDRLSELDTDMSALWENKDILTQFPFQMLEMHALHQTFKSLEGLLWYHKQRMGDEVYSRLT